MLLGLGVIDRSYNYVYGSYGWVGVMFVLLVIAFGIMASYTYWDRSR